MADHTLLDEYGDTGILQPAPLRYCVDCEHCLPAQPSDNSRCTRISAISLIDGHVEFGWCQIERDASDGDRCGQEARFYSKKPWRVVHSGDA